MTTRKPILLLIALTALIFLAVNAPYIATRFLGGTNGIIRQWSEMERGGLKVCELFLPPDWHPVFGGLTQRYSQTCLIRSEMFSAYLGLAGIAALLWLCWSSLKAALSGKSVPLSFLACCGLAAYATVGGIGCLLAYFGLDYWRAANRWSIWILAIALLWASKRIKPRWWFALLVPLCLIDQFNIKHWPLASAAELKADQQFGAALEQAIPGKSVFQIPVITHIDAPCIGPFKPGTEPFCNYDHLRLYLWTKTVRFSHGVFLGGPREKWRESVSIDQLKAKGFVAIHINRTAFPDNGNGLVAQLASIGITNVIAQDERQVCLRIAE